MFQATFAAHYHSDLWKEHALTLRTVCEASLVASSCRGCIHDDPQVDETSLVASTMVDSTTEPDREALKVHLLIGLEKGDTTFPSRAMEVKWLNQPTIPKFPAAAQTKPPAVQQTHTMHVSCSRRCACCTTFHPPRKTASLKQV